ncbi:centrosomal protein of 97 kDa isoform X2 [Osmerus eperlanus]|uniref:centrosomal protein of 97 kDa isoform X2 n=1 Tax=Osmerus eperlanus TaxID=29151 RepID=UPI002E0DEE7A
MGISDLSMDTVTGPVVDLSAQALQKLEANFCCSEDTHTLILDRNHIMKLDYLERSPSIQQLSVASNRLVRMMGVSRLTDLRVLNLPNNSIGYIEGLRDLPHLEWLNLAGNNIKVVEQLDSCVALQHLDLSDNNISNIGGLTKLMALKTLLLHGNSITTLRTVPGHLPARLAILSLAENEIRDLNEVSYLTALHNLEQLSIMSNPCVMATPSLPGFDYRPYVMSWCLSLKILDGFVVSQKEGLKAEWLYSQGKGRMYRPGQHVQLVQYLATVCPLTSSPALETAEDAKLEKILSKQKLHQKQLQQQTQGGFPYPARPTQLDVETHGPLSAGPPGGAREADGPSGPPPAPAPPDRQTEPSVQVNTWLGGDSSNMAAPVVRSPRAVEEHLYLEDVQTDEYKLNGSLLTSESTFLPFSTELDPNAVRSDSEDETETFEPDSLAPEHPPRPRRTPTKKIQQTEVELEQEREKERRNERERKEERGLEVAFDSHLHNTSNSTIGQPIAADSQSQSTLNQATSSDCLAEEGRTGPKQEEVSTRPSDRLTQCVEGRAALRIQAWWRGLYARHCLPLVKEVRHEIRLHRMQEHIVFLSGALDRVQKQYEEERLQRLVQEEAVKFLWKQLQSMQQWQRSVEEQLASVTHAGPSAPAPSSSSAPALQLLLPVASSTAGPACPATDLSFPDSGFQSTSENRAALEDSFLSSGTGDSLETVRALAVGGLKPGCGAVGEDSPDCSLLEQYLSSVQQREQEAEDGAASDRTETPQPPSSPLSSAGTPQAQSLPQSGLEREDKDCHQEGTSPV